MKSKFFFLTVCIAASISNCGETAHTVFKRDQAQLLNLERKWLEAEFSLDTVFLSSIIDSSFIDISGSEIHNKAETIRSMYNNISQRNRESLFVDSFKIEDPIIKFYENTAVVTFIVHTYRKDKGIGSQLRTRFYDVWTKRESFWKAVSSQATSIK